jgi:hypothetical protein
MPFTGFGMPMSMGSGSETTLQVRLILLLRGIRLN